MPLDLFQSVCFAVVTAAYAISLATAPDRRRRGAEIAALVVAAWIGEHTCIEWYRFYAYADGWWARIGHVPLLVPLIWPMVVLSARDIATALWPDLTGLRRALAVGLVVVFDASLMEVVAVAAGYWGWFEPGYLNVPLMGILGWGCFGFVAILWLDRAPTRALWATPLVTVAATHLLLVGIWWGLLRWILRGDLGPGALAGYGVCAVAYAVAVARARRRGRSLPWSVTGARVLATSVFLALLLSLDVAHLRWLWLHVGIAALPYVLATDWSVGTGRLGRQTTST